MPNRSMFNSGAFNGSGFTFPDDKTFSPDQPYILHLVDASGVFKAKIEGLTEGSWDSKINKAGKLEFSIPMDSDLAQTGDLKAPNGIFLYDSSVTLLQRFVITKSVSTVNAGVSELKIESAGLLYLLDKEYVPLFGITGSTNRLDSQVSLLLGQQVNANPITLGYMAPEFANQEFVNGISADKTLLKAIMHIWKQVGGVITIDSAGRLRWDTDNPSNAQYTMTLYDDIAQYERIEDTERIANLIFSKRNNIRFNGSTHDRLSATGSGFIEDTASQAIYGIRPKKMTFNTADPAELSSLMARALETMKDPKITRKISAIDLRKAQFDPDNAITPHPTYIFVGAKINVNPPPNVPNDSTFKGMITSVKRDLKDFLNVEITVADENAISARVGAGGSGLESDSEFFDIIADGVQDEYNNDPSEWDEELFDEIEDLWASLDPVDGLLPPSTTDGDIKAVGAENDAGGTATAPAFVDHVHDGVIKVPFNAAHTQVSDLGTPAGLAFGYLDDSAGTDEGLWFFPPNGTVNADWIPMPSYN